MDGVDSVLGVGEREQPADETHKAFDVLAHASRHGSQRARVGFGGLRWPRTRTGLAPAGDDELMLDQLFDKHLQLWAHPHELSIDPGPAARVPRARAASSLGRERRHRQVKSRQGPDAMGLAAGRRAKHAISESGHVCPDSRHASRRASTHEGR